MLRRTVIAAVAAAAVVAAAVGGLYVTTAPEAVSVLVQPFSLLLLPGTAVAIATAGTHDISARVAVVASFVVYFAIVFAWLSWRGRRSQLAGRSAG